MKHALIEDLFTIVKVDGARKSVKLCDEDHPIFKAHFPSYPILPGFIHLEIAARLFDLQIDSVKKAKFSKMVSPSELLIYEKNDTKFKVFSQDIEVASFTL